MILAHSYGNLIALDNIHKMDQTFKNKYILRWIQLGAPFLGAIKPLKLQIGLPLAFKKLQAIGIPPEGAFDLIKSISGFYSLFPKFISSRLKLQGWYKELMNRVSADKKGEVYDSTHEVIGLFPNLDQKCYQDLKHRENTGCIIGINNEFDQYGQVIDIPINGEKNLQKIINTYINFDMALHFTTSRMT